ncbi:uncharacterized protein LOC142321023 isoform X3 [Lycorma delicatula]|uniref:uncharacterized protein LOC142321023 isoform X3 n=1 Tax=Lycorma delicatula TaxID=130591 RepID=UPI003F51170E
MKAIGIFVLAVAFFATVALAQEKSKEPESLQSVEAPKENLKGAEAAYLAYAYAAYPYAYSAYPYVVPPAAAVILRR